MKIIKHGKQMPAVAFMCWLCECEFIAEPKEYEIRKMFGGSKVYSCRCPHCGAYAEAEQGNEVDCDED